MRQINLIVIHCSATPEGRDFTVGDIDRWHRQRGFRKIGYHYVIYRDGSVHEGRGIEEIGAHAAPFNSKSIGICYIGGLDAHGNPKDTRTDAQRATLRRLVKELLGRFPDARVVGHRDLGARKACPCFDASAEYKNV